MGYAQATEADCVVVGGGPAGMILGLLLARAGVHVVVLEKHADFLRDFRGDTVHASTLGLLDDLGLGDRFAALPHRKERDVEVIFDDGRLRQDFSRLPGKYQHLALVPQWDLLDLLAEAAKESPTFELVTSAECVDVLRGADSRVVGVQYLDHDSKELHDLSASVVVACDGRKSRVREVLKLPSQELGTPFDCLYIRLPREPEDPDKTLLRFSRSGGLIMINRDDYWQVALLIGKGDAKHVLEDDARRVRETIGRLEPSFTERAGQVAADDIASLEIRMDRLRRWWAPGALCIGDAAHAMSPIAGVGINLAIQDAVAAARVLAPALRTGKATDRHLARIERRRRLPLLLTQALQRAAQHNFVAAPDHAESTPEPSPLRVPQPLRTLRHIPGFSHLFGRLVAIGIRPERLKADSPTFRAETG